MSKKKKKTCSLSQQKQEKAQHRNLFIAKIRELCVAITGEDVMSLLPPDIVEWVYAHRMHGFKFITAPGLTVAPDLISEAKFAFMDCIKNEKIVLNPSNIEMSLEAYFVYAHTLYTFFKKIDDKSFFRAAYFKSKLQDFADNFNDDALNAIQQNIDILVSTAVHYSDIGKKIYCFHQRFKTIGNGLGIQNIIEINYQEPVTMSFTIDGNTRPAYKVGWWISGINETQWINLKPIDIGIKKGTATIPTGVFMQLHALNRLSERLDCIQKGVLHYNLFMSLIDPKAINITADKVLIEYRLFEYKVGYLVARLIQGVILIRTFLFITCSRTPEGQKLEEITGLGKLDVTYLAIDKLSTFMSADISNKPEIMDIINRAGLQSLCEVHKELADMITCKPEKSPVLKLPEYINPRQEIYTLPSFVSAQTMEGIEV